MTTTVLTGTQSSKARGLPILSISALLTTILVMLVGSIVRVTGYGLGCPDWPLCYGQAIPPALTGAWVEFSHRLFTTFTSIQIGLLAVLAWRNHRNEKWIFRPALAVVVLLFVQVGLGGLHVILENPPETGLIHTATAMLIVGLLGVIAATTAPGGQRFRAENHALLGSSRFQFLIWLTGAALYFLLLTGSFVTRSGSSLVCPSWPACDAAAGALQWMVNAQLVHRYTAYSVAALTLVVIAQLARGGRSTATRRYAAVLATLLALQISLGIGNVLLRIPQWTRALHLTVGATFWVTIAALWALAVSSRAANPPHGERS